MTLPLAIVDGTQTELNFLSEIFANSSQHKNWSLQGFGRVAWNPWSWPVFRKPKKDEENALKGAGMKNGKDLSSSQLFFFWPLSTVYRILVP